MGNKKLFSVYLGGRAESCNIELHDVVFVVGSCIEETYPQLIHEWFGSRKRLHIDCYAELRNIDGYEISVKEERFNEGQENKLYFVHYGAYISNVYREIHETAFYVGPSKDFVIKRAKEELCRDLLEVHLDDIIDVQSCIGGAYSIQLEKSRSLPTFEVKCGYVKL